MSEDATPKKAAEILAEQQAKAAAEATEKAAAKKEENLKKAEASAKAQEKEAEAIAEAAAEGKKPKPTGKKIRVAPANPFKMHCPTQDITIYPDTITEVKDDRWIRGQLNEGTLVRK
jgi:hypothetical protein